MVASLRETGFARLRDVSSSTGTRVAALEQGVALAEFPCHFCVARLGIELRSDLAVKIGEETHEYSRCYST